MLSLAVSFFKHLACWNKSFPHNKNPRIKPGALCWYLLIAMKYLCPRRGRLFGAGLTKNSNVRFSGRDNRTSLKSWSWMILRIPNPWKIIGLLRVSAPFYAILYQLWCPNFKRVNGLHSRTVTFAIVWAVACVKDTRLEASLNDWLKMIRLMILKGKIPISDKNCDLS